MLGVILLLILLQDFLPEAHPTIPTLGAYDTLHSTYDYFYLSTFFFLHKNNRCFFELVISFIDGSSCKYLSFVILSAFDNCLLKLAPLTSLICLTQNGSDQMKICCIIHLTELRN